LGAGYQIIQSKIAIGSGGLFGKGFLNGSQSYLDYLPEKHTDFIFTLFSEEFGFFGSLFILLLYTLILSRIIRIGHMTRSNFGKLYCYSFATAFFIYVAVNMMMVLGLLPIVVLLTNYVIWWIFNDGNHVWTWNSNVLQDI
jgi:rod shape determining protein RodA